MYTKPLYLLSFFIHMNLNNLISFVEKFFCCFNRRIRTMLRIKTCFYFFILALTSLY